MTDHTPDRWLPLRSPQHAAPPGSVPPLRRRVHRGLRLFAAAGAWGAGLCLVIGLVALVARAAAPSSPTRLSTTAGRLPLRGGASPGHRPGAGHTPPAALGGPVVLRRFFGTGDQVTDSFTTAAHSRWELSWSYRCPTRGLPGQLIIEAGGGGLSVTAAGPAGHGSTWAYSAARRHFLVVTANCAWSVRVTGDR